jgi:hypothetical protein
MRIYEISPVKPLDPETARIKALADAAARAKKAEKMARARERLAKAQKSLSKIQTAG